MTDLSIESLNGWMSRLQREVDPQGSQKHSSYHRVVEELLLDARVSLELAASMGSSSETYYCTLAHQELSAVAALNSVMRM